MSNKLNGRAKKRIEEMQRKKQSRNRLILAISIVFLCSASLVLYFYRNTIWDSNNLNISANERPLPDSSIGTPVSVQSGGTEDTINIPVSDLSNEAKYFTYNHNGVSIQYFVLIGPDNLPHVAINACDVCYNAKKGYIQQGTDMRCINCGRTFSIVSLGTENRTGGCWPSYLQADINETSISIDTNRLIEKSFMFQ